MSIQEVGSKGKERIQGYTNRKQAARSDEFQESLMHNLKSQGRENAVPAAEKILQSAGEPEAEVNLCGRKEKTEDRAGVGVTGNPARIRVNAVTDREAVQNAEVRHMSYEESDNIEIAVTEGYTLKGKMEGSHVYVEAKYEDGRLEAYRVDTAKVQEQTNHKIEQFALETADSVVG